MKLSKSEAGKLGAKASLKKQKENLKKRITSYNSNPKKCIACGKTLPYKNRKNKFCSKNCSAAYNNKMCKRNNESFKKFCVNCGKVLKGKHEGAKYCSRNCQTEYLRKEKFTEIDHAGKFPLSSNGKEVNRQFVKKYLIHKYGHKCSICGTTEWLGKPILLIVDHIDGDIENCDITNYRLVCSNCDATLPTYKNKNHGKGKRKYRRRYKCFQKYFL